MAKQELPEIIPIFPLTGVLLLPGMWLPLHVFEPRYRAMVEDARDGAKMIAMVQPIVPRQDNSPAPEVAADHPDLYGVGCLGLIERCDETQDGRFVVALKGLCRFRTREELPLYKGYRRVLADYEEFQGDLHEPDVALDPERLKRALESFGERNNLPFDLAKLDAVSGIALLNGLCMSLPFAPAEKQALLEATTPAHRERILLGLMGMGLDAEPSADQYAPPTLN
ncbi:MAG TPA: LON peptidase substrate-binding domain-containing protein [bacterium]|nr:LON peptidase substrate-binding domain-containing protein [bacterium]